MALTLRDQGISRAFALQGGYDAWKAAGFPLETKGGLGDTTSPPA